MSTWIALTAALAIAGIAFLSSRLRRCHHRFGLPFQDHVRCMKCAKLFPIRSTNSGEWKIGRRPVHDMAIERREGIC